VLGFTPYHTMDADWKMLRLGDTTVSLILHQGASPAARPKSGHPAHFGLNVESMDEVDDWHDFLVDKGLGPLPAPELHRDGSYGFYLKDSEGNPLEVIYIPEVPAEND
jgi:hypothetical protein